MSTIYLITIGFVSILGQVGVLRELNVAFYGIELIYILAIGSWLFWTALGALIGKKTYTPRHNAIKWLFLFFSLLLPLDIVFIRSLRIVFGGIPGSYLPFGLQMLGLNLAILPLGITLGLLFQWAAKLYIDLDKKRSPGKAYGYECAGGLLGGMASTFFLMGGYSNLAACLICSLISIIITVLNRNRLARSIQAVSVVLFVLFALAFFFNEKLDQKLTAINHPFLLETSDSPYGRITVAERSGQTVFFVSGELAYETETISAETFIHPVALQHPDPETVCICGGGIFGLADEILKHNPQTVDYVEINPVLYDMALNHLPPRFFTPLSSEMISVIFSDPRKHFQSSQQYDMILIGMSDPSSGRSNRFYTREFFDLCRKKLRNKGILAFRLESSENVWSPLLTMRNAGIYKALQSVFRYIVVLPGTANVIIASNSSLMEKKQLPVMAERFKERNIKARMVSPQYIQYLYTNDRFEKIAEQLGKTVAPVNTDLHPVCYQFTTLEWFTRFFPEFIHADIPFIPMTSKTTKTIIFLVFGFCLLVSLSVGMIPRLKKYRLLLLVFFVGLLGMLLETMLLLFYQAKNGALFQNIGILLMVFMGGMTGGAFVVHQLYRKGMEKTKKETTLRTIGFLLTASFICALILFWFVMKRNFGSGILLSGALMFIDGFIVAGFFSWAGFRKNTSPASWTASLYSADLLGGCLATIIGSLFLIPFLGMPATTVLMALVAVSGLLLI